MSAPVVWDGLRGERLRRMNRLGDVLPGLLSLTKIPESRGKFVSIFVRSSLQKAWDLHRQNPMAGHRRANLDAAAKAMRAAINALWNLHEKDRNLLETELESFIDMELEEWLTGELGDVADALERALAAANSTPKRGGRPRGVTNANHEKLQAFIMDFYQGIVIGCSGRLSFDPKNGGSGKLIRALELIEPCLPPGFLPPRLPLKPIHRWIRALKNTPPKTPKK